MQKSYSDKVYEPAEDTFFFADNISHERGRAALEIGTGSGLLTKILEERFETVIGTDISYGALVGQQNKIKNGVCCFGADAIGAKFDLVVCNLPYLPSDGISDRTVDGGEGGLQMPLQILISASRCVSAKGRIVFLTSSLADYQRLIESVHLLGFSMKIIARKRLFFEELILVQAERH